MIGAAVITSAEVALSSEQPTSINVGVDSFLLEVSAIVLSESLHSGSRTKVIPFAKRSRSVEDDGRAEAEKITRKSAAEEHVEDNATFSICIRTERVGSNISLQLGPTALVPDQGGVVDGSPRAPGALGRRRPCYKEMLVTTSLQLLTH